MFIHEAVHLARFKESKAIYIDFGSKNYAYTIVGLKEVGKERLEFEEYLAGMLENIFVYSIVFIGGMLCSVVVGLNYRVYKRLLKQK